MGLGATDRIECAVKKNWDNIRCTEFLLVITSTKQNTLKYTIDWLTKTTMQCKFLLTFLRSFSIQNQMLLIYMNMNNNIWKIIIKTNDFTQLKTGIRKYEAVLEKVFGKRLNVLIWWRSDNNVSKRYFLCAQVKNAPQDT